MDEITNGIGMRLKLIPAGIFTMGSDDHDDENPKHEERIIQPFYCGVFPVTKAQFQLIFQKEIEQELKEEELEERESDFFKYPNHPVAYVSWHQAVEFCSRLSQREGRHYRLLKEAEWEYVCRAGTTTKFFWGEDENNAGLYAWHRANSDGQTHDVGKKQPNAWGIYDIVGNVECWCDDVYRDFSSSHEDYHITRGGSFRALPVALRCALRGFYATRHGDDALGFRVVAAVSEAGATTGDWFDQRVVDLRRLAEKIRAWRGEELDGLAMLRSLQAEAKGIGEELNARGGMELMLRAHRASSGGREIEIAWDGVGDWRG